MVRPYAGNDREAAKKFFKDIPRAFDGEQWIGQSHNHQNLHAVDALPGFTGCSICGGEHYARGCPKKFGARNPAPARAGVITLCAIEAGARTPKSEIPNASDGSCLKSKGFDIPRE